MQEKELDELSLDENILRVKTAMKKQVPVWGVVAVIAAVLIVVVVFSLVVKG